MRRRRSLPLLLVLPLLLLLAGAGIAAYGSTEPPLDWSAAPKPSVANELREMIAARSLALTIDEAELNALLKPELYERRRLNELMELTGADIAISGDTLIVKTDVRLGGALRLPLTHRLRLTWDKPDVVAEHYATSLKALPLPTALVPIGIVRVPLAWDAPIPTEVDGVAFEEGRLRISFRVANPFGF
ncbi:hypothetical protein [Paenibacillus sp.]|uniref:hypothetical protein n=1 Tax=Paenibacillus sp. TaxID=58172 RepID=UPI002D4C61A4|nr:hypothetical protein [Paenibacillus sp.]HZG84666.1 hypothetical protein [Paenibacillus sp.]